MNTKLFWVLFAGAVIYWGVSYAQEEFLQEDIKEAPPLVAYNHVYKASEPVKKDSVRLLTSEEDIASGKKIYNEKCVACHGIDGAGARFGANLTDKYWIKGGSLNDVFKTIKYGIPEKGMVAWKSMLTHTEMEQVTSYIISLQGTNPPNAKAAQGDLYEGGY